MPYSSDHRQHRGPCAGTPGRLAGKTSLPYLGCALVLALAGGNAVAREAVPLPPAAQEAIERGEAVDLLVRIAEDAALLPSRVRPGDLPRRQLRRAIKDQLLDAFPDADFERLKHYDQLPMLAVRVRSAKALARLAARSEVLEIYEDIRLYPVLAQSLPLIGQATAAAAAQKGTGTAVAVLDTGVDYARTEFGSCTAPGVPAGCKVAAALDFAPDDGALDASGHGSRVAAMTSASAPEARLLALDVFDGSSASSIDVVDAIDWVIANRAAYNIVAINMSLGGSTKYTSTCGTANPFRTALQEARGQGIVSFVASGNSAFTNGLAMPACTPEAVSVGAVYDANVGGLTWSACTDSASAADQVACFSNSASFLNLLAPGALITALGSTGGGTSYAAPHAAGAYAVLRGARPAEDAETALARLATYGKPVTDVRNGVTTPRIDLAAALQLPGNDAFAAATPITGEGGSAAASSQLASAENGEPAHAGASPNRSLWWTWTAPAGGDAVFDTDGSGFDTVLAAYTGGAVNALALVAENNDDNGAPASRIAFRAQAGVTYRLALAGNAGDTGAAVLNWSLTEPVADLSVTVVDSPDPAPPGSDVTYTATVTNHGPYTAEAVALTFAIPAEAVLRSASAGCTAAAGTITCSLGDLAVGQTVTRQVVLAAGSLTVAASADGAWGDPAPGNDNATATTTVAVAAGSEEEVPLPGWSLVLLAAALGRGLVSRHRSGTGA